MERKKGSAGGGGRKDSDRRYMKERGFTVGAMSGDVCKRGVALHIFSDPRVPVSLICFTVPQRCSFSFFEK